MDNEDLLSYKLHLVLRFIDENQEGDYVEEESTILESVDNSVKEEPAKLHLEKTKLIQQQLILLLHAHKCSQREKTVPNIAPCSLPHCASMKAVLEHMTTCDQGRQCNYAFCVSSRQIICHWKNCSQEDCPVCKPLRNFAVSPNINNALASGDLLPNSGTNLSSPISSAQPMDESEMSPSGLPPMPELSKIESSYQLPPPDPPAQEKEWHPYITNDLRNHLVGKLVKAIFPSFHPAALHDQRIKDLILYARKVEKEMFEIAIDREEYYHLLAEKIYKIQKELQVKKNWQLRGGDSDRGSGSSEMIFSIKEPQEDLQNQNSIMRMDMTGNRSMNVMADMNNSAEYFQNGMNPEMPSNPQMMPSQGMRPMLTNSKPMQMHQQQNNHSHMNPPHQFQQPNHQMMQQQQGPGSMMGQPNQQDGIFMPRQSYANSQMMPGQQGPGSMMGQPNQQDGIFMPRQSYANSQMMPGQQGPGSMMGQPNQQDGIFMPGQFYANNHMMLGKQGPGSMMVQLNQQDGIFMPGQSYANNQMMPGQQDAGTQGMRPTGQMPEYCLHLSPNQQQQGMPQQMQQMNNTTPHARNNDQMQKILARFKAATTKEERTIVMNELKKTPHLFAAFLKANQSQFQ